MTIKAVPGAKASPGLTQKFDTGQVDLRRRQASVVTLGTTIKEAVTAHGKTAMRMSRAAAKTTAAKASPSSGVADAPIHGAPKVLLDPMFYPQHDKRTESKEYKAVHIDLTQTKDLPCLVCGVRNSSLGDKKENRYGANQMETHHHVIEWALANAIEPVLFNKALRPNLGARHKDEPMYQRDMTAQEISDWVDHSPDNLWVLCDVHHRHRWVGIHEISYPLWAPQDMLKAVFVEEVAAQTALADAQKKSPAKSTSPAAKPGAK